MKTLSRSLGTTTMVCVLASYVGHARAACNKVDNWFAAPTTDTKVLIGYEPPDLNQMVESGGHNPTPIYPALLPDGMLAKAGSGTLSNEETSSISYFEKNNAGRWRICRHERWWPPSAGGNDDDVRARRTVSKNYRKDNPLLASVKADFMALHATQYFYDPKGRIARISFAEFEHPDKPAVDIACRRYDDKDRISLWVDPRVTTLCPVSSPDPRDTWEQFKYAEYNGEAVRILHRTHYGNADGTWQETFKIFRSGPGPDDIEGAASADSEKGVTEILQSNAGKLDNNTANMVTNDGGRWGGATYQFTKPAVPLDVIDNTDLIYNYERRRITDLHRFGRMVELFQPHQHISRHRYYMIGAYVVRHEQVDSTGKLIRLITVRDWVHDTAGPNAPYDQLKLTKFHPRLIAHQIFHRVYEPDASGTLKLVAVSWNRTRRLLPSQKVSTDMADLVYGTPAGKSRWKTKADFEKAFNTSAGARHVFPDAPKGYE